MTRQRVKGVLLKHLSYITPFFTYTHKHAHAPPHAHAHTFKHALTHKYKFSAFTNEQFLYSFLQIKNIIHPASTEVHTNLFCTTQTYKVTKKKYPFTAPTTAVGTVLGDTFSQVSRPCLQCARCVCPHLCERQQSSCKMWWHNPAGFILVCMCRTLCLCVPAVCLEKTVLNSFCYHRVSFNSPLHGISLRTMWEKDQMNMFMASLRTCSADSACTAKRKFTE